MTNNNKDKQAGISVVVQEKREETRKKRREEKVGRKVQEILKLGFVEQLKIFWRRFNCGHPGLSLWRLNTIINSNLSFGFYCL